MFNFFKFARRIRIVTVLVVAAFSLPVTAWGEVEFFWVTIDDVDNAPDPLNQHDIPNLGSVGYVYQIAKHEVTNDQYAEYLNAVAVTDTYELYHPNMGTHMQGGISRSGSPGSYVYSVRPNMGDKPVVFIGFDDSLRFANWLHNGQPTGVQDSSTTEGGAYTMIDGVNEVRSPGATHFVPTYNEWYKAAYYKGGVSGAYWFRATRSNSPLVTRPCTPTGYISDPGFGRVNYNLSCIWNGGANISAVGSAGFESRGPYGTYDQAGNVDEWTEGRCELIIPGEVGRVLLGGSWLDGGSGPNSQHVNLAGPGPFSQNEANGLRIARLVPPDPIPTMSEWGLVAMTLLILAAGSILALRGT